jgi:surface antigen
VYEKHVPDFFRQKGFEYQCTAWANTRWRELGFDGQVNGNGGEMAKNAGPTSSTPTLHALGSYGAGTNSNPGHVMVVEEISGDGSRIRISEMNNGDDNWNVGHLNEYRDDLWLTRDAGGVFRYDGHAVNFAKFPGT